jgi:hypothetical protein
MSRYIIPLLFIFFISCNSQTGSKESDEIANAKWYYYSYAGELKAYDKSGGEVQPLTCDVKFLKLLKVGIDTTKIFFDAFNKDTLNLCSFRPYDLVGIIIVKNKLYLPIYHTLVFGSDEDSTVLKRMNRQSMLLQRRILENSEAINPWLQLEAKRRKGS